MTISIEPLSPENIADLGSLYTSVYKRLRPAGYFEKKYAPVYPGRPPFGFLAYAKNASRDKFPVGFYGALPCSVFSGNKKVNAAQCTDAMTHPGFRRQGLFLQLARLTMNACGESGTRLLFGFPNQYSLPGFLKKLGWEKGERMDCFRLQVNALRFVKVTRRLSIAGSFYQRYSDYIVRRHETPLLKPMDRNVKAGLLRDEAWVNQKCRTGMRQLMLEDGDCWIRPGEELLVGDLAAASVSLKKDLTLLKNIARQLGLPAVQFHCSPDTPLHRALIKETAPVPSFTVVYKDFGSGITPHDLKFTLADIDIF